MRILYLSPSRIPSRTANSVHVMRMCEALAQQGHEVVLFASPGESSGHTPSAVESSRHTPSAVRPGHSPSDDDYRHYGVEKIFQIVKFHRPRVRLLHTAVYSLELLRNWKKYLPADLVYARDVASAVGVAHAGVPMIFEAHAGPSRVKRLLEGHLLGRPNCQRLVVISAALEQTYRELFPQLPRERIVVAHDGAVAARPGVAPASTLAPRRADHLQVGYVGHLYAGRGIELIVALAQRMPEVDFHIVGGRDSDVAEWRGRTAGVGNLVFHGFVAPADCAAYCRSMDVLAAPYQNRVTTAAGSLETSRWMSPLKIFEYMAAGKAIVASDLPVLREVLTPEQNALLAVADDPAAWEQALRRLFDPALRERLGDRASRDLATHYTWSRRAERVLSGLELGGTLRRAV